MASKAFYKICAIIGALLITWAAYSFTSESAFPGYLALIPVLGSFLLIASIGDWPALFKRLFNNKVMQHLGAISYPLYLWHWPSLAVPALVLERPIELNEKLMAIAATILLSELTHRFVEQPFRYSKIDLSKTFSTLVAATTCSILIGALILNTHTTNIFVKEKNLNLELSEVTSLPVIHSDGCHVNWGVQSSKECLYGDLTSDKTMVLFGDSHAAQWFDAVEDIAKNQGYKLISLTKSACSALKLPISNRGVYNGDECRKWQSNSIERIKELKPEVLIASAFSHYNLNLKANSKDFYYLATQQELHQQLLGYVNKMVYLTDTPKPVKNIPRCLSHNSLESCNQINRSSNAVYKELIKIDPYQWFCDKSCSAVKENFIVYRDASHITRAAAKAVADQLEEALIQKQVFN
jgi:Predicted acyltransferases